MRKIFTSLIIITLIKCGTLVNPKLVKFTSITHEDVIYESNHPKITNRIIKNNIHIYEVLIHANCNLASEGSIEMSNDTINLKYEGNKIITKRYMKNDSLESIETLQIHSEDECNFNLRYEVNHMKNKEYILKVNGKLIP